MQFVATGQSGPTIGAHRVQYRQNPHLTPSGVQQLRQLIGEIRSHRHGPQPDGTCWEIGLDLLKIDARRAFNIDVVQIARHADREAKHRLIGAQRRCERAE